MAFRKEEKITVATATVKEGIICKEYFADELLGVDVARHPLSLAGEYVGRDAVIITPEGERELLKKGKIQKFSHADVRNISEFYKIIKNSDVRETLTSEIEDCFSETIFKGKKESFVDYSGLLTFKDKEENIVLFRNSYIPGRSLQLLLGVKDKVIIPFLSMRYIHTEKGIEINVSSEIEKLSHYYQIIEALKSLEPQFDELKGLKLVKLKTVSYRKGVRTETIKHVGNDILGEAMKSSSYWDAIRTIVRIGYKHPYKIKRKVDKFIINLFQWLLEGKSEEEEEILPPFSF